MYVGFVFYDGVIEVESKEKEKSSCRKGLMDDKGDTDGKKGKCM